jgi:PPOX class probable F420-dependent enzyme
MAVRIPDSHRDLLTGTAHGFLTTLMPDGSPQASVVWVDTDGECVLVNTTLERRKTRNLLADPRATLLVLDPADSSRWIELRGQVREITREGAEAHADALAQRYHPGARHFYGDIHPVEQREKETRVIVRIEALKINLDAIFK